MTSVFLPSMTAFTIDYPFTFGDLVCYRYDRGKTPEHDGALLYLGPCSHPTRGGKYLIDILDVSGDGHIEHKDPAAWQKCVHLERFVTGIRDVSGTFGAALTPTGTRILVGGKDVTDEVEWKQLGPDAFQVTALDGNWIADRIEIRYDEP